MCGRYYVALDEEEMKDIARIIRQIERKNKVDKVRKGEIFPTNTAPISVSNQGQQDYAPMDWGIPKWDNKGVVINARSETAAEKKMFSKSLQQQRCVIPANGFYEWQKIDANKPKDKFLFQSDESPVMYMAGIYKQYKGKDHFVIMTRDANLSIEDIHDRMPVLMYQNEIDAWLNDDQFIDFVFRRDNIMLKRTQI